jgi:hypothetical protein
MNGHCKDCKFWEDHTNWHSPNGEGDCKHPNPMWKTLSLDDEGLVTPPDFGCVQFEAKS